MAFKKKIAATIAAMATVSALGITAMSAVNDTNYSFRLTAYSGKDAVITPIEKREYNWAPSVLVTEGIPERYDVDYNVRTTDDSFATDYVSVGFWDMWESEWVDMEYYPGMGVVGRYYSLASKYDGLTPESVTTRGYWTP